MIGKGVSYAWAYEFRASLHAHSKQYQDAIGDYNTAIGFKAHEVGDLALRAKAYDAVGNKKLADMDRQKLKEVTEASEFGF